MPHSDDFDFDDDDDTAFLVVATQAEASQHPSFAPSPRPAKRRKVLGELIQHNSGSIPGDIDLDAALLQTELLSRDGEASCEVEGTVYEDQEQNPKKLHHKIHVPVDVQRFEDQFLTQTQGNLDEDLGAFRGPIWKKPQPKIAPKPPPRAPSHLFNRTQKPPVAGSSRLAVSKTVGQQCISNLFKKQVSTDDDAALAARLQAEEDDVGLRLQSQSGAHTSQSAHTATDDVFDLPSDAFSSSAARELLEEDVTIISINPRQGPMAPPPRPQLVRAPLTGLKQTTIFGAAATQEMSSSQGSQKKHAWPLKNRDEPPTHHKLDDDALKTWVYPTNLGSIRDYQFNIVKRSLFHNTLVALPTGLGKTFIAATVMLNYYRWTKGAQIVFMAPTKPLIAQQMDACYHIVGIPRSDTVLMTGETSPAVRGEHWLEKRVFFMTPQTVINDLKHGICDPKRLVLIVVDEAHKATGGYAYTEVMAFTRRFNQSFRVLALTATPGGKVESVQAVIDNLDIARVELRTEESIDIVKYTHEKQTETEPFEPSDEQELIMDHVSKAVKTTLEKLNSQNAHWPKDPMKLTAFGLSKSRQTWMRSEPGARAPQAVKGMVNAAFNVLSSLAHGIGLLQYHGISPFYSSALSFQRAVDGGELKGKSAKAITEHPEWMKMMDTVRAWTSNPDFVGHPKLEYLRQVVANHFLDTGEGKQGPNVPPSATRVMIFASYRDSTEDICRVLKKCEPMIRPHVFVGQSGNAKSGSEGMSQKKQNEVVKDFKSGKYNTLIATSIGEEGLDIGDVDLIVCYDASSSPIRMLQRIGRTGRKRLGRVVLLLMKGKEEQDYERAKDSYSYIQKSIADPSKYNYRDEQSMRIVPKDVEPVVDKRIIEIPPENSQPVDLNEKGRRATGKSKAKRPPKKFHMPDNVRTGFVTASRVGSDDEGEDEPPAPTKKAPARKTPVKKQMILPAAIDMVQLPFLNDVLLNPVQERELARKYASTSNDGACQFVRVPDIDKNPAQLLELGRTKYIKHGRAAATIRKAMHAIRSIDDAQVERMKRLVDHDMLMDHSSATAARVQAQQPNRPLNEVPTAISDDESDLPSPAKVMAKPNPNPKAPPRARKAPSPPKTRPRARQAPAAPRLRAPQRSTVVHGAGDMAAEGASSSPPPTPADMRIATQGIDIGSSDTSGGDEEEGEMDSDMEDFIAKSDEAIETVSSSLPHLTPPKGTTKQQKRRGLRRGLKPVVEERGEDDGEEVLSTPPERVGAGAGRKWRSVEDDSDE